MPLLLHLRKLQGKGDGEKSFKKRSLYIVFRLTRRSRVRGGDGGGGGGGEYVILTSYSTSNKLLLADRHIWTTGFKNAFKVDTVNLTNLLSPPSVVKKVHTGSKNSQGT